MDIKHCAEQRQKSVFCTVQIKKKPKKILYFKLLGTEDLYPELRSSPIFSGRKAEKALLWTGNCTYLYAYTRRLYGNTFYHIYIVTVYAYSLKILMLNGSLTSVIELSKLTLGTKPQYWQKILAVI
jgi:hypothetical protein